MASYVNLQTIFNEQAVSTVYKFRVDFQRGSGTSVASILGTNPPYLCQTSSLPKRTNEPMTFMLDGIPYKRPGRSTHTQEITLTFIEINSMDLHNLKNTLRGEIWTPNTSQRGALSNRFTTILKRLDPTKLETDTSLVIWQYTLFNSFLQNEETPNFDGNANTPEIITLTIGFENFDESNSATALTGVA